MITFLAMSRLLNLAEKEYNKPIYRIISIERLFELFDNNINVLAHPKNWDDPYENFILRSKVRRPSGDIVQFSLHKNVYGQCWSFHRASDAMWRLYSDGTGVRIKTTASKLLSSLYYSGVYRPDMSCALGKVRYMSEPRLMEVANNTYGDASISDKNLFRSLLVKRLAFRHEREVRLLYLDVQEREGGEWFKYALDPHNLIGQIMIDPRMSSVDADALKVKIKRKTGFRGDVKRSLLYKAPDMILQGDQTTVSSKR